MCYVIMPHTHQWDKITVNKILKNHKLVLCDDQLTHMVPVPPAELPEINAFTTSTRLTVLQAQDKQVSNTHNQPMYSNIPLVNQNHCYLKTI